MYVEIKRCKDPELEAKLEEAAVFFASQLISRQLMPYLEVEVKLLKSIRDYGSCICLDWPVNAHNKPRGFEVILKSNVSEEMMLRTLAHEMVHVKQFARCELAQDHEYWYRTAVPENTQYHDLPWEVEAACLEQVLYANYIDWLNTQHET